MADLNEVLLSVLSTIRVPKPGDRVHKDECAFSFDSPESEGGLYVCMSTFLGFGKQFVERHYRKTGQRAYLHIKRTRKPADPLPDPGNELSGQPFQILLLPFFSALTGVEGGFEVSSEHAQFEEEVKLVILPERLEVTSEDLSSMPDVVSLSLSGILSSDSASHQDEVQQWDGEVRLVSKHAAGLQQLDSGLRIPPSGWRCQVCDLDENLWMNLTDGAILCGRRYFDGSGGNNHAMQHYRETGFPLAVKLGTITPAGADVYSYDEDDMVLDPGLPAHLAHFGIDMMQMQKTDKTMTELEIDMNQRIGEWEVIQESGGALQPLCGPGYTGMKNLGNSCYLNSVMQVLFSVPDFQSKAKLGHGLLSGEYSRPAEGWSEGGPSTEPKGDQEGIAPRMFKSLVGKGHPEFSTNRQQDAQEFLLHFVNMVERYCRSSDCPSESFRFLVEERIHCLQSDKVKYTQRAESLLQLPVPLEHATNKEELSEYEQKKKEAELAKAPPPELVRAHIPFAACLSALSEPETLEEFWSSALQAKSMASKTTRFASFPDYLVIQIKKFTFGLDWVPKKLDVSIEMPDSLDVSSLRGAGLQPGEEELPDLAPPSLITPDVEVKAPVLDESVITQLAEMGFPVEACRKAVFYTGNTGAEAAMNWVMTHMDDPDFSAPLVLPGFSPAPTDMPTPQGTPDPPPSEEHLATIISMGFSRDQASRALRATMGDLLCTALLNTALLYTTLHCTALHYTTLLCSTLHYNTMQQRVVGDVVEVSLLLSSQSNSLERAVDWIFSHIDDLDAMDISEGRSAAESVSESVPAGPRVRDGEGKYELFAFISHMGTSTMCGHYVCHIKKEGRWVIYNDQKVCASEKPPKDLGYIYFYQRASS
ncbi:UNVERIFIED_CONTAM: hypothetical protein FKN15_031420 [Acipenser sinensis]